MTTIYKVSSHMKSSTPDGREAVFSGTPEECDRWYNALSNSQRINDRYLFLDSAEERAVYYRDWLHAGCSY